MINAYKFLVEHLKEETILTSRRKQEENVRMDLTG